MAQYYTSVLERKLRESEDRCQSLQAKFTMQKWELDSQVAAAVSEREGALEQATQLSSSIQELEQKLQGLEAQKDQLEEDRFTAQTALRELQSQHEQVYRYNSGHSLGPIVTTPHSIIRGVWTHSTLFLLSFCLKVNKNETISQLRT